MSLDNQNSINQNTIANQKLNKENIKEVLGIFFSEFVFQMLALLLFGTAIGLYFVIGFWAIVAIIPMVLGVYYFIKNK